MPSRPVRSTAIYLTILCTCAPLFAQSNNYHVELSDGTSGMIVFTNDSKKSIEAFQISAKCGDHIGSNPTYDALDGSGTHIGFRGPDGSLVDRNVVIGPGINMPWDILPQQLSNCAWEADADAVIYTDGTYEGSDESMRRLEAKRDGIVAGVSYWAERLNRVSPTQEELERILTEANRQRGNDLTRVRAVARDDPQFTQRRIVSNYWMGRSQVDGTITVNLKGWLDNYEPEESYKRLMQLIKSWQTKIDNDIALKKLDATFPLPTALAEQAAQLQAQAEKATTPTAPNQ
jgi:hypothetical protein